MIIFAKICNSPICKIGVIQISNAFFTLYTYSHLLSIEFIANFSNSSLFSESIMIISSLVRPFAR